MIIDEEFQSAAEYYQNGNLYQAELICKRLFRRERDNPNVLHLLGMIYYQKKDHESAAEYIKKSIRVDPNEAFAYYNLANVLRDSQMFEEAITNYRKALQINPDISDAYYNMGIVLETMGRISDAIVCYEEVLRIAPGDAGAHNNLGVIFLKNGRTDEAICHFEKSLEAYPENFKLHYNLGLAFYAQKKFHEAITSYQNAIKLEPNYADAHNDLGTAFKGKGLFDDAIACYNETLKITPDRSDTYYNLGIVLKEKGLFEEAIISYQKALRINPNYVDAHNNLGIVFQEKGLLQEAIACYKKALLITPGDAITHWNFSLALLLSGDFEEGWKEYEWRLKVKDFYQPDFHCPRWDGSDVSGRTILLRAEQGFGDSIQFIRYAPMVAQRGAKVIVQCQKELTSLLRNVEDIQQVAGYGEQLPQFDFYCPLLSLPLIFGTTLESIPSKILYINVDFASLRKWSDKVRKDGSKLRVGLVWAGREQRSCSLESFSPLSLVDGVTFFSLQKGDAAQQAKNSSQSMKLVDYTDEINDFSDTAALIESLDLIISVDTAVAHLAGALGKPVWTLLPFAPDWRWMMDRDDSPWYPTMKLFHQSSRDDWESVIESVKNALRKYVNNMIHEGKGI
jgi:tetratricopeptide (TPR) repeat protein